MIALLSDRRRNWRGLLILAIVVLVASRAVGQEASASRPPAILLGSSVHISADNPTAPHVESFLALNPTNPSQLVATSIVSEGEVGGVALYVSRDAGRSWERATSLGAGVPQLSGGDPIVYYDPSGAALFCSLCEGSDCSFRVWRSADGGLHWDSASAVSGATDRQYLAVDMTSGPYRGRIYAAGTKVVRQSNGGAYPVLAISASTDGARTFSPSIILDVTSDGQSHGFGGIADLLITSRGTLVVPFQSSPNLIPGPERQVWTVISQNGGRTFAAPRPGVLMGRGPSGFRRTRTAGNIRAVLDPSSGPFKDRIYVAWVDFNNDRYEVKVAHSDDLGVSWSAAVTVNDNNGPHDSSNAAITVNRDGIVSLVWNDRRDDIKGECYRLYVSASLDGGDTFLPNVQVNPQATCPNSRGNWSGSAHVFAAGSTSVVLSGVPDRFSNGGETQGLVATPDGRFHVAWINGESGVMQLWYTSFTVQPGTQQVGVRRVDRSADVSVEVSSAVLDFDAKSLWFTVSLKNQTSMTIRGPLGVVLSGIESDFGGMTVSNADNGLTGRGAEWMFVASGQLAPGAVSEPRTIRWHFDGQVPSLTKLDTLRANFRVLAEGR
jgi:hypothetical protein